MPMVGDCFSPLLFFPFGTGTASCFDLSDSLLLVYSWICAVSPQPNSHGCVHAHPEDIEAVWHILVDQLGVVVHNNTFGKLPYPYKPQGLLSIELVED